MRNCPGLPLELHGPDGSLIETWESADIPHAITGLPVGEGYVLKETAAPEGFQLAEDVTFAVEETAEIQFVGMVDERSPEEPEEAGGTEHSRRTHGTGGAHAHRAPDRRQPGMALVGGRAAHPGPGRLGYHPDSSETSKTNCNVTEGRASGPSHF